MSGLKIPVGECYSLDSEVDFDQSWIVHIEILGRNGSRFIPFGTDLSLSCPDICATVFPFNMNLLDIAREQITRVANLDKVLQRSRLKNMDSNILHNGLVSMAEYYMILAVIVSHRAQQLCIRELQLVDEILLALNKFLDIAIGYRQWFICPGVLMSHESWESSGYSLVEHVCRRCNKRGWIMRATRWYPKGEGSS